MARVMICDDDKETAGKLAAALRAAKHDASLCGHTMDVLRDAAAGRYDLLAFGLDMAGFGGAKAIEALAELAPEVPLIGLHKSPAALMRTPTHARLAALLPRPVSVETFMYAVTRALEAREKVMTMRPLPAAR